jgi:hypothetical protein
MSNELHDCPLCKSQPKVTEVVADRVWTVECADILHTASVMNWQSQDAAIHEWNRRTPPTKEGQGQADHIPDAGKMVVEPSVVPMPEPCPMVLPQGWIRYTPDQLTAYADAKVSEATRELVDGLNALLASYRRVLPPGSPQSDYEKQARALIAKYTQTQKESK